MKYELQITLKKGLLLEFGASTPESIEYYKLKVQELIGCGKPISIVKIKPAVGSLPKTVVTYHLQPSMVIYCVELEQT